MIKIDLISFYIKAIKISSIIKLNQNINENEVKI